MIVAWLLLVSIPGVALADIPEAPLKHGAEGDSSQIHLQKRHLPMLTRAIHSLNNTFYTTILQQIKNSLERQGSLDADDLMVITKSMGVTNLSFYCGYMTARGEAGYAIVWPFTIFAIVLYSLKHFYPGPIIIGTWFTDWESSNHNWEGVCFSINGREVIQGPTGGVAIGGIGCFYHMSFEKPEFDFVGLFPLIIVNNNPL